MTRTVDIDIAAGRSPGDAAASASAGGRPARRREHVQPRPVRLAGSVGLAVVAVMAVALSPLVPDGRPGYVLAHALTALPPLVAAHRWAAAAGRRGAPEYRTFWRHWRRACALALASAVSGVGAAAWSPLLALDLGLLLAAGPYWIAAGHEVGRVEAGRLDPAVDVLDALMAVVVLGTPGVLLLAEPLLARGDLAAAPLALFLAASPAGLYGAALSLARLPPGQRLLHALGAAIVTSFTLGAAVQVTRLAGGIDPPLAVPLGVHAVNLAVVAALPLWSHRQAPRGLEALPVERQVRRHSPMPAIGAVVLPAVAVHVLVWRRDETWTLAYVVAALVAVVGLNALRHAALGREARRLSNDLARMAEERRVLLADMLRALDDDRRRIVAELHAQAVGSLTTLGSVVQAACVSLPSSTAVAVRESLAHLQGDLSTRAEELRLLLVALRRPTLDAAGEAGAGPPGGGALAAALRAHAADVCDAVPADRRPHVDVAVDPALALDRRTATIVCRVAEEALLTAVLHAGARTVTVRVRPDEATGGVVVEVGDDGDGLDPAAIAGGSSIEALELFTALGGGELTVRAVPGEGTVVRSRIGGCDGATSGPGPGPLVVVDDADDPPGAPSGREPGDPPGPGGGQRGHLRLIP